MEVYSHVEMKGKLQHVEACGSVFPAAFSDHAIHPEYQDTPDAPRQHHRHSLMHIPSVASRHSILVRWQNNKVATPQWFRGFRLSTGHH